MPEHAGEGFQALINLTLNLNLNNTLNGREFDPFLSLSGLTNPSQLYSKLLYPIPMGKKFLNTSLLLLLVNNLSSYIGIIIFQLTLSKTLQLFLV